MIEGEDYDSESLDQFRGSRGIAAGFALAIPLWSIIVALIGNLSFRKAVLYLFCMVIGAAAIWVAKAISTDTEAATKSEHAASIWHSVDA